MYDDLSSSALTAKALQFDAELKAMADKAEREKRDLTQGEKREYDKKLEKLDQVASLAEVRRATEQGRGPTLTGAQAVPAVEPRSIFPASARGSLKVEAAYRPDVRERSFIRDVINSGHDSEARERLDINRAEAELAAGWSEREASEYRDMQNLSTQGAELVPPLYLANQFVFPATGLRPFADALPTLPLPPTGTSISIPKLASGVAVAARADAATVQETDGVTATVSHTVNEIAGLVDIGRQALMRSDPGLDTVILQTLRRRYDAYLDTQLLAGSGTAPQHRGLENVTSPNTVTFTSATPTSAGFLSALYDGVQQIATDRKGTRCAISSSCTRAGPHGRTSR